MKIAAYNIASGGFNSYDSLSDQPERLPLLQKVIKKIGADFIGLVDTFRWREVFTTNDLRKIFGYQNTFHININDQRVDERIGIAVLTNLPVKHFKSIRLKTRDCLKTQIDHQGKVIDIFTLY